MLNSIINRNTLRVSDKEGGHIGGLCGHTLVLARRVCRHRDATPTNVLSVAWLERVIGKHVQSHVQKLRPCGM